MKRREFITLLGGAAALAGCGTGAADGEVADNRLPGTGSRSSWQPWTDAFVERLRQLGWIEERTVTIEYRSAEGSGERFAEIAASSFDLKWTSSSRLEPQARQ